MAQRPGILCCTCQSISNEFSGPARGLCRLLVLAPALDSDDYFTLAGSWQRRAEAPETEGLLCLLVGILTGTSFEMILLTPLAVIARTT